MVNKTKEYDMFKKDNHNRAVLENHVNKVMDSIQRSNLLEFRPIIIDKDYRIIDGQHRLEAAKRLGVEIYYEIHKDSTLQDMILLNTNQKMWTYDDYLNYYVNNGNENYIKLKKYIDRWGFNVKQSQFIFSKGYKEPHFAGKQNFNIGNYVFPSGNALIKIEEDIVKFFDLCRLIEAKRLGKKTNLKATGFIKGVFIFINNPELDFELFLRKIELRYDALRPCTTADGYIRLFLQMYNYKNSNPISIDLD